MQITDVRVFPVDEEKLKAYASIVLDHCFIVNDLKVIQGKKGLFISMPSRRRKRGGYRDVAHPLNNETRGMIEQRVLAEYEQALASGVPVGSSDAADEWSPAEGPTAPRAAGPAAPEQAPVAPAPAAAAPAADAGPGSEPPSEPPLSAAGEQGPADAEGEAGSSLEEVERRHLRDSFWSVS